MSVTDNGLLSSVVKESIEAALFEQVSLQMRVCPPLNQQYIYTSFDFNKWLGRFHCVLEETSIIAIQIRPIVNQGNTELKEKVIHNQK